MIRTYSELILLPTFNERLEYLKLDGSVGKDTFAHDRYLNQKFYKSYEWKRIRDYIITRDNGCNLGVTGYEYVKYDKIFIHHMNPIGVNDILDYTQYLTNTEYLISTTFETHQRIHYSKDETIPEIVLERRPGDTCPWR